MAAAHKSEAETVENILERVRLGDVEAYSQVIHAFQGEVWRVVMFCLRDMDASADLVQQTFVNAYFALDRFEEERDFGAWVRGIARNLVRQELRRRGREDRRYLAYSTHLEASADNERADEHEHALREALTRCREKLSDPAQRALEMRYHKSREFPDIAEALGRTVAATRQLLQRVRLQLRACITQRLEAS